MSYDAWKTRSPDDGQPDLARCHRCNDPCGGVEDEYGEFICADCADNAAERAWERHCTNYEGPLPLIEQQRQAMKFK